MKGKIAVVLLSSLLFACVQAQPPQASAPPAPAPAAAPAPPAAPPGPRLVVIRRATCDTFLGLTPEDRAAVAMFYMGYTASRVGLKVVNVNNIPDIETGAIANCSAHPERTVAWAFAAARWQIRR